MDTPAVSPGASFTVTSEDATGKNEKTSPKVAKVAAKVLREGKATPKEVRTLAGAALTQTADRRKSAPAKKKGK